MLARVCRRTRVDQSLPSVHRPQSITASIAMCSHPALWKCSDLFRLLAVGHLPAFSNETPLSEVPFRLGSPPRFVPLRCRSRLFHSCRRVAVLPDGYGVRWWRCVSVEGLRLLWKSRTVSQSGCEWYPGFAVHFERTAIWFSGSLSVTSPVDDVESLIIHARLPKPVSNPTQLLLLPATVYGTPRPSFYGKR